MDPTLFNLDLQALYNEVDETLKLLTVQTAALRSTGTRKPDMTAESREMEREMRAEYEAEMRYYSE